MTCSRNRATEGKRAVKEEDAGKWELTVSSRGPKKQNLNRDSDWSGGLLKRERAKTSALQKFPLDRCTCTSALLYLLCRDSYGFTQTHTWPVLGTQLSRAHQTAEVLLHCTAVLAVPLSARPGARLRLLSRAEMAGVERVPPEGILSLPNAAAPQLLATLLNQRRRHKVKRKIGALGKNNSSRLDACQRKKGRRGARE